MSNLLQAQTAAAGGLASFLPLILMVLVVYFLIFLPQRKRQKETKKMLDAIKKGDDVVSIGGIIGTVTNVEEGRVTIKIDDSAKITFKKEAIAEVITKK